jgi:hypothetical protein
MGAELVPRSSSNGIGLALGREGAGGGDVAPNLSAQLVDAAKLSFLA